MVGPTVSQRDHGVRGQTHQLFDPPSPPALRQEEALFALKELVAAKGEVAAAKGEVAAAKGELLQATKDNNDLTRMLDARTKDLLSAQGCLSMRGVIGE